MNASTRAAETAARESYGRILALLASRTHDIAAAEDALSIAFTKALTNWPSTGVPKDPSAWLFTVARNNLIDGQRHQTRFPTDNEIPDMPDTLEENGEFPDKRLGLLLVCAHPAIDADLHTPLMLQTVLGLDAKSIARVFLVSPAALSKRLVRAKSKIRDARIPFRIPEARDLDERCTAILEAIYAVHTHDWLEPGNDFGDEAYYLANLLTELMPDNAEVLGAAALIAFGHARQLARIENDMLIPVSEQNMASWNDALTAHGLKQLAMAHQLKSIGRFQLEAAIQSVHMARKHADQTDWRSLLALYEALLRIAPSAGALVAHSVVVAKVKGDGIGLEALKACEAQVVSHFQPLWAAYAELYTRSGNTMEAIQSYEKALSLTTELPLINFLKSRMERVKNLS